MSVRGEIAIIGMAGVFPKAPDVAAFWENILAKVDGVGEAPPRWGAELVFDPESAAANRIYTKRGGFISELSHFDPLAFGVPPRSVEGADPEHFIALRIAREALADSGYLERPFDRTRTGVILGRSTVGNRATAAAFQHGLIIDQTVRMLASLHPEYSAEELARIEEELRAQLPPFNAETAPGLVPSVMCGRIANRLDLMGPAYTVDAACASSLLAVEQAMSDLVNGKLDMVLAGGVQTATTAMIAMIFSQLGALSRAGKVGSFSPDADGTLLGEGAGILVLKRREDAERDHDRVYALIKSVGMSSDGRAVGILAPRVEGQELAMRRAYELAGISPRTVSLIEGHGTGTPVGDAVEIEGLGRVFGQADGDAPAGRYALGSIKSMIGHPIPAAGSAGLIKVALALYHKVLPPTLHAEAGNAKLASTPFYLNSQTRPWIHGGPAPRRAAVSAFGFGGINAHAVLEEHTGNGHLGDTPQTHLHRGFAAEAILLSAKDRPALITRADHLCHYLTTHPTTSLPDLAYTLNTSPPPAECGARLGIVASSVSDLVGKLGRAVERLGDPGCQEIDEPGGIYYVATPLYRAGALAFLFPGMGAQYVNMLSDLCVHFPEVRAPFDQMDRVFARQDHGYLPSEAIFPPPTGPTVDPSLLWTTSCGFAAVIAANYALLSLISTLGIQPDAVLGHSMGAHTALGQARMSSVSEAEFVEFFLAMNECYEQLRAEDLVPPGSMLAITTAERERVLEVIERGAGALTMAMDNCPHQMVLGGSREAVATAAEWLREAGVACTDLPFPHPYHTAHFATFADRLREMYVASQSRFAMTPSAIALYSCVTAELCPDEPEAMARLVTDILSHPVRFRESIEAMYRDGVRIFIEVGPRGSLSAFVDDTLRGRSHLAVPADVVEQSGLTQLAHLVAQLAAHHVPMDLEVLYAHRAPQRLPIADGQLAAPPATKDPGPLLDVHLPMLELTQPHRPASDQPGNGHHVRNGHDGAAAPVVAPVGAPAQPAALTQPAAFAQPAAHSGALERERVMSAYLATMERFLEVQRSTMIVPRPPAEVPAEAPRYPLLGSVVSHREGEELVAIRRLDLAEDVFLHDHTFGRGISVTDPTLLSLAVVPFTVSMEMLAEAAAALCPGQLVVGMRDVRGHQWIGLDESHATVRLVARRNPAGEGREVRGELWRLREGSPASQDGILVFEGTVCFADTYPAPPALAPLTLTAPQPYQQSAAALYSAGRMFHGPRLQGVVSLARWGRDGTEATLETLPTHDLFASVPDPTLVIDPVLLDAAGQLVGFWAIERLPFGIGTFPFALKELRLFGTNPAPGTRMPGRARIAFVNERQVRADIDVLDPRRRDGRPLAQLIGWSDHCLDLTTVVSRTIMSSQSDAALGTPWPAMTAALPAQETFACWRIDELPPQALAAYGRIPQRILAGWILSRAERAGWAGLTGTEPDRSAWLLERAAAKEAARVILRESQALALYPADISVLTNERGEEVATGSWAHESGPNGSGAAGRAPALRVSLARCDGVAVAITGSDHRCRGIGIHLERRDANDPDASAKACARAAAGKALGCPPWGAAGPAITDRDLDRLIVRTVHDGDWVAAVAIQWEELTNG